MQIIKNSSLLAILFLLFFSLLHSQKATTDSMRGSFTYLLQFKPNIFNRDHIVKELYSLQISDKRAFFISENKIKFDSAFSSEYSKKSPVINMTHLPSSGSNFLIIQTNDNSQFFESVGMTLLSYNNPVITDWKLVDESMIINTFMCKKAEVHYKGRDWIAWYSTEIPLPYGPYKFNGLPGLIVKITDKSNDYQYEIVKSESNANLKGKTISLNKSRYLNSKLVTKKELSQARTNFRENARKEFESMGTIFSQDNKERPSIKEAEKKGRNPIELED
ncbi:GLPGLI family protein [Chryseobacterium sp. H3056]|uniref:GLPGLI family protein n=1 Tax=Kaistella daneshvariae TaxID=2487074 RepID=A0A3N0WYB0_9FLAO|nr:GLPGLI family protein [Kaistella daneshvariae]ROI10086.1 GLPGLI family protein [Kaistella daneshvariae]